MNDHERLPLIPRIRRELREQSHTFVPSVLSMVLTKIPWILSLRFAGNIGAEELAAAALATTLMNVTGLSLSVGLSSALTTLTGQARGDIIAKHHNVRKRWTTTPATTAESDASEFQGTASIEEKKITDYDVTNEKTILLPSVSSKDSLPFLMPLTYLYRGIFVQMCIVIPVGIWWLHGIKPVLLALGQTEKLSEMTAIYLRILTPGLWSYSLNWTLTVWLQAIEMADVPAYAAFVGLAQHIPTNLFFIHFMDWGYLGVGVATVMFQVIQPLLTLVYVFGTRRGVERVLASMEITVDWHDESPSVRLPFRNEASIAVRSVVGIRQYLSLAIPGILIISEWWASEVVIFLSGRLLPSPELAVDGMTIYQSINSFCFMFPTGMSVAGAARLGKLLGLGDVEGASFAAKTFLASASVVSLAMGSMLYFVPHTFFPSFFSPDEAVVLETSRTIPLLAFYVVADGVQSAVNGVVRGCGRQCITMPIVIVAYWVVGVPLGYCIAFKQHGGYMCEDSKFCGIVGLVAGMTAGTFVHLVLLSLIVLGTTNWRVEAQKARTRIALEKHSPTRSSDASAQHAL